MSAQAAILFQKHNPAFIGLLTGVVIRLAWEVGFIPSTALLLRDVGIAIWITLNHMVAACEAFLQFAIG